MPRQLAANCAVCRRALSGSNLYVDPDGRRRGCTWCRTINAAVSKARAKARAAADLAAKTGTDKDRFAGLVAAIQAEFVRMPDQVRAACYGTPDRLVTQAERDAGTFARKKVTREKIAELTGLDDSKGVFSTVSQMIRRSQAAHSNGTVKENTMPLPEPDGTWPLARLALWRAALTSRNIGNPGRWGYDHDDWAPLVRDVLDRYQGNITVGKAAAELGIPFNGQSHLTLLLLKESGRWDNGIITDERALELIEPVIAEHGPATTAADVFRVLDTIDLGRGSISTTRISRLIREQGLRVRPGTPAGPEEAAWESTRWDGKITGKQLSDWSGMSSGTIRAAVRAGRLTQQGWQGNQRLFDPGRLAPRRDGRPGLVDSGHDLALPRPPAG